MTARNLFLYFDWCGTHPIANVLYFLDLTPGAIDHALADLLRTMVPEERLIHSNRRGSELGGCSVALSTGILVIVPFDDA